ncbi:hypothetical protein F5Y16DRAFT_400921 [Xylariaceae sp. FL0255]|nr:hypothetical protein F5Y16DRAFT_400921 [Xylariaceae sp. FL0255]
MARGNQRDKAREKNLKQQASMKSKNTKSGTEMAKDKEALAALMRQKQEAGESISSPEIPMLSSMKKVARRSVKGTTANGLSL